MCDNVSLCVHTFMPFSMFHSQRAKANTSGGLEEEKQGEMMEKINTFGGAAL